MSLSWERWLRGYEVVYREDDEYKEKGIDWISRLASEIRYAHKNWGFVGFFIFAFNSFVSDTIIRNTGTIHYLSIHSFLIPA